MPVYLGLPARGYATWLSCTHKAARKKTANKTVFRNTTRCLKLTEEEAQAVERGCHGKGLRAANGCAMRSCASCAARLHDPSLAEILGVRLLLVNVLRPLAAGQKLDA